MTTTAPALPQAARRRARMAAVTPPTPRNRVATNRDARRPLEQLLATAGWTNHDLRQLRAVTNDELAVLIAHLPPDDVARYVAWADVAHRARLTPTQLQALLAEQPDLSPTTLLGLIRHAQTYLRESSALLMRTPLPTPAKWAVAHARAGNTVAEVKQLEYTTPAWLIAWLRTGDLPTDLAPYPVGESHLWAYMDAAAAYPNVPDAVLAATVTHAPTQTPATGDIRAWLTTSWADPTRLGLTS